MERRASSPGHHAAEVCTGPNQREVLTRAKATGVRDVMSIPRKPSIPEMDQSVEARQTEDRVERPSPPDFPRYI